MLTAVPKPKMHTATTPNDKPITAQHKNKHALAFRTKKIHFYTPRSLFCHATLML